MLGWALTFLVVALIAGVLGFTTIAGAAIGIAKLVFYVFLLLFVVSLIMNFVRGRGAVFSVRERGMAGANRGEVLIMLKSFIALAGAGALLCACADDPHTTTPPWAARRSAGSPEP